MTLSKRAKRVMRKTRERRKAVNKISERERILRKRGSNDDRAKSSPLGPCYDAGGGRGGRVAEQADSPKDSSYAL